MLRQTHEFSLAEGDLRCHDDDPSAGAGLCRRLEGRLYADDDGIGIAGSQRVDGGAGSGVAGDDHGLETPFHQLADARDSQLAHLLRRSAAVGSVGGVAKVEEALAGHLPHQLPQDADAAQTGVKNGDFPIGFYHARSSFSYISSIIP